MTSELIGASVWEEKVYQHLVSHEDNERELLVEYERAADASGSAAFQYLARLILEDEERHHRLFRDLASALRADAELRPEDPAIPRLDRWGDDPQRVLELSERLIERERSDAKDLRRFARELKDVRDTTLWALLVKLMEMDTDKHIEILEFARNHARRAVR